MECDVGSETLSPELGCVDPSGAVVDPLRGGRQLHGMSLLSFMGVPGLREQFKRVPPTYYRRHPDCVDVRCPCGAAYRGLRLSPGVLTSCEGCGRCYVATSRAVFAAHGMTEAEWQAHKAEALV